MNGEYFLDAITISTVDDATASQVSGSRFDLEPAQPSVSIADAEVAEGNGGATLSFPVTVANPTAQSVTVQYSTSNGTATAGSDYTATSGSLTIAAGQTTGHIDVPVLSDKVKESTEALTVTLTSPGYGTLADGTATGTITDDDPAVTPPVVTPPVVTPRSPRSAPISWSRASATRPATTSSSPTRSARLPAPGSSCSGRRRAARSEWSPRQCSTPRATTGSVTSRTGTVPP